MADPQQNATAVGWQQAELFADGGSRGNPGPSGIGFYLQAVGEPGQDRSQPADVAGALLTPLASGGWYLGPATNNQAEYQALIWALQNAREFQVRHLSIRMDSELVVRQLTGQYQVKNPGIKPFYNEAQRLLQQFASVEIIQVPREQNSIADQLANAAMDSSGPVGNYPVAYQQPPTQLDLAVESRREPTMAGQGTYYLSVKEHFDAAHALIGYQGECRNLHGHTWDVEAEIVGTQLDAIGIIYDFKDLKKDLRGILDQFDHHYLNEVAPFDAFNSTAENLARVVYQQLAPLLPAHVRLHSVVVWESPIARLEYRED